uniref:Tf2-1-like SH3-like domain-containing protein n=1 Tax=Nicotiana tabacum TaxID=4097 RepID=A0A1S4BNI5_TOBAC|nr:PREDICTED: uncharacterized protein LOC107810188 [Nicotiana tabacum]
MASLSGLSRSWRMLRACIIDFGGKKVLLKVLHLKGVIRFGKKGKLSPRYIGMFLVLERVGAVAYRLALPLSLARVHPLFHISMIRKYYKDKSHVLHYNIVHLDGNLTYEEESIAIVDRQFWKLGSKVVYSMKVLWKGQLTEEAIWESESNMRNRYLHLFTSSGTFQCPFKDKRFF